MSLGVWNYFCFAHKFVLVIVSHPKINKCKTSSIDPPESESKLLVVAALSRDNMLIGWQVSRLNRSKWVGETGWRLNCARQNLERKVFWYFPFIIKFTWTGRKRFWTFVKLSDDIWSLLVMALAVIWRPRCEKEKNNDLKKKTKDIVRHLVGFVVYDSLLLWTTAEWKAGERSWDDGDDQHRCPHYYQ